MKGKLLGLLIAVLLVVIVFSGCSEQGQPPKINFFIATPSILISGNTSVLNWSTTGATSVSINNGIGNVNLNGPYTVVPTRTQTYILTATNSYGSINASVVIYVSEIDTNYTYTNNMYNFSVVLNENWNVTHEDWMGINIERKGLGQYDVVKIDISLPLTLTGWTTFENQIEVDLQTLPDWKDGFELISSNYTTFKGLKAHEIIYRYGEDNTGIKEKQLAIEKDNKMYHIFYSTDPIKYEEYLDEANEIINSFTLL